MIKAVLFDLDGTLLDRDQSVKQFISHQYDRLRKSLNHIPKEIYMQRFITLDDNGYVWKDKVYEQLIKEFGIGELTKEQLLEDYIQYFKYHCIPFPQLIPMLENLKKQQFKLGLITNGKEQFQMNNIQALRITSYFDKILISESEGIKKPDPIIFQRTLDRLEVSPEQSVFIGDHLENDVFAAKRVGMNVLWKSASNYEGIISITDLREIELWITKWNGGEKYEN
ncbi:HAD family hydrolase [Gracilibacillus kekensis]|uniref:Putative hydrolase of the HAD superfamily n=1 Tax=Gracilibacillus kekensis TaxID=1027249 RepID=A0A1M7QHE0_9BACI|nr:HAD-IA family hydrolase [Gracilibacillus kekensis]SHN30453.1 putative hydrolase of the HAD superfamily [Gracilibacillus kekensis]